MVGLLCIVQTSPEVDAPACTPACCLVAFDLKRFGSCLQQLFAIEVVAWIESDEMALMAMLEVPIVPVIIPFVQITHVSDGIGMQSGEGLLDSLILLTKDLTCGDGIDEQFADDG